MATPKKKASSEKGSQSATRWRRQEVGDKKARGEEQARREESQKRRQESYKEGCQENSEEGRKEDEEGAEKDREESRLEEGGCDTREAGRG